jgi:hypothetical protein
MTVNSMETEAKRMLPLIIAEREALAAENAALRTRAETAEAALKPFADW